MTLPISTASETPGDDCYVQGYVRNAAADGSAGVQILWLDASRSPVGTTRILGDAARVWTLRAIAGEAPKFAAFARAEFVTVNQTRGDWFADTIDFRRRVPGALIAEN